MNLRKVRICLLLYVAIDLLIGYAGIIPLTECAAAQFTQVTGTVIDPNSIPYAFGTISATLVSSASPTLNGLPYTPPTQPTGLDQNGKFIMQLADNTALLPGATQWKFTVCSTIGTVQPSIGKGPVCFTAGPITISGTSQDITATLNAAALALTLSSGSGTTINPTNGVIPVRANATTFNDSPLSVASGNVSDSGNLTINGTQSPSTSNGVTNTSQVNSFTTFTDTAAVNDTGFNQVGIVNPAGASSTNFFSYTGNLQTPAANTQNFAFSMSPYNCVSQSNSSGNFTYAGTAGGLSCYLAAVVHNGSGTVARQSAFNGQSTLNNSAGGLITTNNVFVGVSGLASTATGTITTDATFSATNPGLSAAGTMTHHYAYQCIAGQTGGVSNPDGWCFFSALTDKSQVGILSTGTPLTISAAGNGNGVLALAGNTSGTSTFTPSAVAGTSTNAVTMSNVLLGPAGLPTAVTYAVGNAGDGLYNAGAHNVGLASNGALQLQVSSSFILSNPPICDFGTGNNCFTLAANSISVTGTGTANGQVERGFNVNVTPVTVSANVTTDQNLMAVTIPANNLNVAGRTFRVFVAGVYSTPAASTATITIELKLCSVSGCAAGNVADLIDVTSSANPGTVTNNAFNLTAYFTTQTAGAAGRWEAHGIYGIDLGALNTSPDSFFNDTNTATIAGTPADIDTTAQNFLQVSIAFSAASASNSATERQLVVEVVN